MDNEELIWIIVIALAALVLIGLIVAAMRKKSNESKRVQAQQLREEALGGAAGLPDEGIPAGTRWTDVPMNWTCPECGARKDDFEMTVI